MLLGLHIETATVKCQGSYLTAFKLLISESTFISFISFDLRKIFSFFWAPHSQNNVGLRIVLPSKKPTEIFFLFSGKRERPKTGAVDAEVFDMRGWERMGGGWAKFFFFLRFFRGTPK